MADPNNTDRRYLTCCKRGPAEFRPVLHLPNPASARSTLELRLDHEVSCKVLLAPRHTLLLRVLAEVWNKDEGRVDTQRGYRTKRELTERLRNPSNPKPVTETTVGAYVREVRAEISNAIDSIRLEQGCELRIPNLIESERGLGYRIGTCGIDIMMPRTSPAPTI